MIDYYLRQVPLPINVEGVTVPNDDGSFDIYINSRLSPAKQQHTLEHELMHLKREHFYLPLSIDSMERQADGEAVNVVLHPPAGKIPCFRSETALAAWLRCVCIQQGLSIPGLYPDRRD